MASGSLYVRGLQAQFHGVSDVELVIDDVECVVTYLGQSYPDVAQVNFLVPPSTRVGNVVLGIRSRLTEQAAHDVIPIAPSPSEALEIVWVADGEENGLRNQIKSGAVKIQVRGVRNPAGLALSIDGIAARRDAWVIVNEQIGWYELNFTIANAGLGPGRHTLYVKYHDDPPLPIDVEIL